MNKKWIIYSIFIGFIVIFIITIIFPVIYPVLYVYLVASLIYFGIIVKNVENFGKIAIIFMIGSVILYLCTLNISINIHIEVATDLIKDAGMLFFFVYLLIIIPKYSSRFHMGMEDSGVGKYHIHEGFVGVVLYIIMSSVMFIPLIIAYYTPWNPSLVHSICLILGGGGNILATFFIARDWDDVLHGLFIEKVAEGEQPEEHESFWTPPKHIFKKYIKINDFTTGFILCGSAVGLYYSPLFGYNPFKLMVTIFSLCLLTFGGFLVGRSWIDMLKDRFGETINRPLLLTLKDSLTPDQKILSVDSIIYPIWIVEGTIEKKKRRLLFFKKKIKIEKTILIDDISNKILYLHDNKIGRFSEFNEDMEENIIFQEGYFNIKRDLTLEKVSKKIKFLNEVTVNPGILPLYAVKLKNESNDEEEYLGVHFNTGHKISLSHDYSINYIMPFKEEGKKVKNILLRISNFFKSFNKNE